MVVSRNVYSHIFILEGIIMKQNLTELVFILDRSGSMTGLEADTIGGFNAMLQKQKKAEGGVLVTTVLFNHESKTIHDRVAIDNVPLLTEKDYCVGGCTALLDAVSETVEHIKSIHKYARAEDVPQHTLFVITTDGMENASTKYSCAQVKSLIEQQKEHGWEFLFFGANIDAVDVGCDLGIAKERVANFNNDAKGINLNFAAVSEAVSCLRADKPLKADWKKNIDEDYKKRKK